MFKDRFQHCANTIIWVLFSTKVQKMSIQNFEFHLKMIAGSWKFASTSHYQFWELGYVIPHVHCESLLLEMHPSVCVSDGFCYHVQYNWQKCCHGLSSSHFLVLWSIRPEADNCHMKKQIFFQWYSTVVERSKIFWGANKKKIAA